MASAARRTWPPNLPDCLRHYPGVKRFPVLIKPGLRFSASRFARRFPRFGGPAGPRPARSGLEHGEGLLQEVAEPFLVVPLGAPREVQGTDGALRVRRP